MSNRDSIRHGLLGLSMALVAACAASGASAACFTVSVAGGSTVNVNYSPLDNSDTVEDFQIEVHNNTCGSAALLVGVANTPLDDTGAAAGGRTVLGYNAQIDNGGAAVVLSSNSDQRATASAGTIDDGDTVSATWHVRIPAHSVVPYAQREFTIYVAGAVGGVYAYSAAAVHLSVASVAQVFFAGSAPTLTVDFGELTSGEVKNLDVHALATVPFDIRWSSENDGVLKNLGAPNWTIPYAATVDGANAGNNSVVYSQADPNGTNGADVPLPVIVTVGDVTGKRAGTYRDVVTITIWPR